MPNIKGMVGNVVKYCPKLSGLAVGIILITTCITTIWINSPKAQESSNEPVYTFIDQQKYHPDGFVGKPNFAFILAYGSVKKAVGEPVVDQQQYHLQINLIPFDRLTLLSNVTAFKEDTLRYKMEFGGRFYLADPIKSSHLKNPDGVIGRPVLEGAYGFYYSGSNQDSSSTFFKAALLVPVSTHFSLFAGYYNYDYVPRFEPVEYYGGVRLYIKTYELDEPYRNPDVAIDGIGVELSGGQSEFGSVARLQFILGVSPETSIRVSFDGQFLDPPYDRQLTAGLGFAYYPNF